ncbi:predicted protein [Uncinocarpus reesii 1704]|uniref:Uncharacterized protein n=1 Tax=Uncinocarpus reesii (strain UAMH 1704) TaxID=336963 RepID=C4JNR6_UNCRE|nr:uncharacterized protein UREG_04386 [Uncinocarpus reesii 1704]EEP79540.1 predicted protein [Uncinocarpus reesii 1704]
MAANATDFATFHSYLVPEALLTEPAPSSANTSRRPSASNPIPAVSSSQKKKQNKAAKKASINESRAVYFSMLQR